MLALPKIGSTGKYLFKEPFQNYNKVNSAFTCRALTKLSEFIANGNNPKKYIYDKYLITDQYEEDVKKDVVIITLRATSGVILSIPAEYLESIPVQDGIAYAGTVITVNVGLLPVVQDVSVLNDLIKDTVRSQLGLECLIDKVLVTPVNIIDEDTHLLLQRTRRDKRSSLSMAEQIAQLTDEKELLIQKLNKLEEYIVDHYVP